jgi:hypothetical protein
MKKLFFYYSILLLLTIPCQARTIYVDINTPNDNDGSNWANAYGNLQSALDVVADNDEIWVAAGTYQPDPCGLADPREATFQMINSVAINGGYAGFGATDPNDRNIELYETILSGDIGITDEPNDNCYHIFYDPEDTPLNTTAVLDGFTITAGNANGEYLSPLCFGGGMYNGRNSNPTITNCTFTNNSAYYGGGMFNFSPLDSTGPVVTNCTFTANSADIGGGMYNWGSGLTVTNCTFTDNSASDYGGGMYNSRTSTLDSRSPTVTNCTFISNSASYGGGMYTIGDPWDFSCPTVTNCTFVANSADIGGGMYSSGNGPIVANCIFTGNIASYYGGGMYNYDNFSSTVTNSILWDNTAGSEGNEIYNNSSTPIISYCNIQGGYSGGTNTIDTDPCFVNLGQWTDPCNTPDDPNDDIWVNGDYHMQPGSPCIDIGDNNSVTSTTDFDGKGRVLDGDGNGMITVDMGVYEYQLFVYGDIVYVDCDATSGANNGLSWENAFLTLQDAIYAAAGGHNPIWVAEGTYYPAYDYGLNIGDRGNHFRMINNVAIYGGFTGAETELIQRDVENNRTILSGDLLDNDILVTDPLDFLNDPCRLDNCHSILYHPKVSDLNTTAVLDGFTITAGNADDSVHDKLGGGMCNEKSSPTVTGCTFIDNAALGGGGMHNYDNASPRVTNCTFTANSGHGGGGLYNDNSSPIVTDCTFIGNSANDGGGMYNWRCSPTVTNCTFSGNSASYGGGGMLNGYGSPTVTGCKFIGNSANDGGGMRNDESNPTVTDCIFTANSAGYEGAGMCNESSNPRVINCTFTANSAERKGGGMHNGSGSPTITNCTFTLNSAGSSYDENYYESFGGGIYNWGGTPTVTNCTFTANSVGGSYGGDSYGGGIYNSSSSTVTNCIFTANSAISSRYRYSYGGGIYNNSSSTVTNCIFWVNTAGTWGNEINYSVALIVSYCDIKGGYSGGTNIIDSDPLFVSNPDDGGDGWINNPYTPEVDESANNYYGNLRLQSGSPCIDAGENSVVTELNDLDGLSRIVDGDCDGTPTVDMGAYELDWLYLGDFEGDDCDVDLKDFAVLADSFQQDNPAIDIAPFLNPDGIIDFEELMVFAEHWLGTNSN